jgi:hypothetical protein
VNWKIFGAKWCYAFDIGPLIKWVVMIMSASMSASTPVYGDSFYYVAISFKKIVMTYNCVAIFFKKIAMTYNYVAISFNKIATILFVLRYPLSK